MSVGQTARLNMFWGIGTLAALLSSGMWLVNRLGRKVIAATGLLIVALAFVGLILSGAMQSRTLFLMLVFVLGVGSGLSAAGALTLMVDFTMPQQAGLLMGAWTIAHQLAEVVGNIMGGVVIDTVFSLSNSYLTAFNTVFGLEVVAAIAALGLLSRISVAAFLSSELGSAEAPGAAIA
jgi:BCD family chlorophyll transporter-like MFS transporter